jgi:methylmalonyl-CoA/ethylmalonyl-CoA epimerase
MFSNSSSVYAGLSVHHFAVACHDLAANRDHWKRIGFTEESDVFSDPAQGICGQFLIQNSTRLELLQDLPGSKTVAPWLKKGTIFYHIGFLTDDIAGDIVKLENDGAKLVRPPVPSVYFGGRRISFLFDQFGAMLELIETE